MVPTFAQVTVCVVPTAHFSPPIGLVTDRTPMILNGLSQVSVAAESMTSVTLIRQLLEMASATDGHLYSPPFGVEAMTVFHSPVAPEK
ncbi:MAG: hypothetical protein PHT59_01000 [Candidatus Omnitrophica bacterium]|nr:hypothetical protein [Candidatus Omnitrophota bacterium]